MKGEEMFYSRLKSKQKKDLDNTVHHNLLFNTLTSMFEWSGLPDTIKPEILEALLIVQGHAPIIKIGEELYTAEGSYSGEVKNFVPTQYTFANVGVGNGTATVGVDCEVCWNNNTCTGDTILLQYADILTEIDVSERLNLLFTRYLPIPKVSDQKEKVAIEGAIQNLQKGVPTTIVDCNTLRDRLLEGVAETQFLDLSDVSKTDKLQYLNQYRDNIIKRFFQIYGQGLQNTAKMAQQSTDEIHGTDAVAMLIPLIKLHQREAFCSRVNALFGTTISVKLSEAYEDQYAEMVNNEKGEDADADSNNKESGDDRATEPSAE